MTSGERSTGYVPDIPGARVTLFEPHPIDVLRGEFNQHVIGPLSHVIVVRTLDSIGDTFLQAAQGEVGKQVRQKTISDTFYRPRRHAVISLNNLNRELQTLGVKHITDEEEPINALLTPRQRAASIQFGTPRMRGGELEAGIFAEINTIANTIEFIDERHPELNLGNTQALVDFLRDPETHRIFRGFGKGGNAFVDGFRRNAHPATLPWWYDRHKPVLDTAGPVPQTTREVRDAARASREINERVLNHPLSSYEQEETSNYGLTDGSAKRFSSGCPAKHITFRTDVPNLVTNELSLSTAQVDSIITLVSPPVIQKINDTSYAIRRDSYAETCGLLATALEIVAS